MSDWEIGKYFHTLKYGSICQTTGMKNLIVANWKMNPKTFREAEELFETVRKEVKVSGNLEVVVCSPFVWLVKLNTGKKIKLGAQNCHWEMQGAYTGEVSPAMLADSGVGYVIIGHSERRQFLGETDQIVNLKIKASRRAGLKPILCVGEREGEEMATVVERQLNEGLAGLGPNFLKEIIIAYEPVWAISTGPGKACLPDNALSAVLFIRRTLAKLSSRFVSGKITVLYGGSVNSSNAAEYLKTAQMNGFLVGGASLDSEEFMKIVRKIAEL